MAQPGKFVLTRTFEVEARNPEPKQRKARTVTIGDLTYNGEHICYTLEGHDDNLTYSTGHPVKKNDYSQNKPGFPSNWCPMINGGPKDGMYQISEVTSCLCYGTFTVQLAASPRFTKYKETIKGYYDCYCDHDKNHQVLMPSLNAKNELHGRSGILLHCGLTFQDTLGCILLGEEYDTSTGTIKNTELAFQKVYEIIKKIGSAIPFEIVKG